MDKLKEKINALHHEKWGTIYALKFKYPFITDEDIEGFKSIGLIRSGIVMLGNDYIETFSTTKELDTLKNILDPKVTWWNKIKGYYWHMVLGI